MDFANCTSNEGVILEVTLSHLRTQTCMYSDNGYIQFFCMLPAGVDKCPRCSCHPERWWFDAEPVPTHVKWVPPPDVLQPFAFKANGHDIDRYPVWDSFVGVQVIYDHQYFADVHFVCPTCAVEDVTHKGWTYNCRVNYEFFVYFRNKMIMSTMPALHPADDGDWRNKYGYKGIFSYVQADRVPHLKAVPMPIVLPGTKTMYEQMSAIDSLAAYCRLPQRDRIRATRVYKTYCETGYKTGEDARGDLVKTAYAPRTEMCETCFMAFDKPNLICIHNEVKPLEYKRLMRLNDLMDLTADSDDGELFADRCVRLKNTPVSGKRRRIWTPEYKGRETAAAVESDDETFVGEDDWMAPPTPDSWDERPAKHLPYPWEVDRRTPDSYYLARNVPAPANFVLGELLEFEYHIEDL